MPFRTASHSHASRPRPTRSQHAVVVLPHESFSRFCELSKRDTVHTRHNQLLFYSSILFWGCPYMYYRASLGPASEAATGVWERL